MIPPSKEKTKRKRARVTMSSSAATRLDALENRVLAFKALTQLQLGRSWVTVTGRVQFSLL